MRKAFSVILPSLFVLCGRYAYADYNEIEKAYKNTYGIELGPQKKFVHTAKTYGHPRGRDNFYAEVMFFDTVTKKCRRTASDDNRVVAKEIDDSNCVYLKESNGLSQSEKRLFLPVTGADLSYLSIEKENDLFYCAVTWSYNQSRGSNEHHEYEFQATVNPTYCLESLK